MTQQADRFSMKQVTDTITGVTDAKGDFVGEIVSNYFGSTWEFEIYGAGPDGRRGGIATRQGAFDVLRCLLAEGRTYQVFGWREGRPTMDGEAFDVPGPIAAFSQVRGEHHTFVAGDPKSYGGPVWGDCDYAEVHFGGRCVAAFKPHSGEWWITDARENPHD